MTFSTRNFDPLTPLALKFPNFAIQLLLFRLQHTDAVVTHAHVLQNFYTTWVRGCCLPKTTFRTKIGGGWTRGAYKKNWDPLHISATVEASNFKFGTQLGFGTRFPKKTTFMTKIGRGLGQGSIRKNLGPPIYFCNRLKNWYTTGLPCQTQVLGPN